MAAKKLIIKLNDIVHIFNHGNEKVCDFAYPYSLKCVGYNTALVAYLYNDKTRLSGYVLHFLGENLTLSLLCW